MGFKQTRRQRHARAFWRCRQVPEQGVFISCVPLRCATRSSNTPFVGQQRAVALRGWMERRLRASSFTNRSGFRVCAWSHVQLSQPATPKSRRHGGGGVRRVPPRAASPLARPQDQERARTIHRRGGQTCARQIGVQAMTPINTLPVAWEAVMPSTGCYFCVRVRKSFDS
jgi:hypothetical protein